MVSCLKPRPAKLPPGLLKTTPRLPFLLNFASPLKGSHSMTRLLNFPNLESFSGQKSNGRSTVRRNLSPSETIFPGGSPGAGSSCRLAEPRGSFWLLLLPEGCSADRLDHKWKPRQQILAPSLTTI